MLLLLLLLSHFSHARLCVTPKTAAHQYPPSLGFSRQEHWSRLPFPSPMHESEKWKWSRSDVSDPQRPHGLQPTRLLSPWDLTLLKDPLFTHHWWWNTWVWTVDNLIETTKLTTKWRQPFATITPSLLDRGTWWATVHGVAKQSDTT